MTGPAFPQELPFGAGDGIWGAGAASEACEQVDGAVPGLSLRGSQDQMFPRCCSLPGWLLGVGLFMYLFVLDYKQNKKGFYNPVPRRPRVQDVI